MSSYVNTQLINCNRLASVQARSGNDTNPALFTNTLQQTIRLNVGDKVSVDKSFISEIGAGNSQTIEFSGRIKGQNKVSEYTKITPSEYYYQKSTTYDANYRLGYYRKITTNRVTDEYVELRDNLAPLIYGYYITSNEYPNYIQQPRRFAQSDDTRGTVPVNYLHYDNADDTAGGKSYNSINRDCVCSADWIKRVGNTNTTIYKQVIDNTRYTLFIKDLIVYSQDVDEVHLQFPNKYHNGIFQEATYHRVRDRLDINVNPGFNTPSAIADQITRQLTETKNEDIFEIFDTNHFRRPITKTIETTTYKPINAQNLYNFCSETLTSYEAQVLPATSLNITQGSVDYISTFGYIGIKRPEIYEAGKLMAESLVPNTPILRLADGTTYIDTLDYFEGFQTVNGITASEFSYANESLLFTLNILYTRDNLEKIRDYLDTQALYPELWDNLNDTENYQDANMIGGGIAPPTLSNSRFFHINKYTNDNSVAKHNETFGDDSFTQRAAPNNIEMGSVPLFFQYNESERDNYLEPNNWSTTARDGLNYGFGYPVPYTNYSALGVPETIYLIGIDLRTVAGVPRSLFTTGLPDNIVGIDAGRRIGFDFHATAYSTAIITPYSGYSNVDIGTKYQYTNNVNAVTTEITSDTCNFIKTTNDSTFVNDITPYQTMTYIGANNPSITYDNNNNRFEFFRLHTSNNIGNKAKAGNNATTINNNSLYPAKSRSERAVIPDSINGDAGSVVYKINPRPSQFGYSPSFKPYTRDNSVYHRNVYPINANDAASTFGTTGNNTQIYQKYNDNITPYKIFDSHGGIYIDNWGFDADNWEDNLWDILGFDYGAVNAEVSSLNVLTQRVDNENNSILYRPTTNAEIVTTDAKVYVSNQYGANMYYTSLPYPTNIIDYSTAVTTGTQHKFVFVGSGNTRPVDTDPLELWNEVSIKTVSTSITATNLQKSVLRPYYTIHSSILESFTTYGGNPSGSNLPIISVVNKYGAQGDFFYSQQGDIEFTITRPTMISDITTSIYDSDGKFATVDKTSAVIYKIQKIQAPPMNLVEELLKDPKKKK